MIIELKSLVVKKVRSFIKIQFRVVVPFYRWNPNHYMDPFRNHHIPSAWSRTKTSRRGHQC